MRWPSARQAHGGNRLVAVMLAAGPVPVGGDEVTRSWDGLPQNAFAGPASASFSSTSASRGHRHES